MEIELMQRIIRTACVAVLLGAAFVSMDKPAQAGHPVYVAPVMPAVVGYTARRGGLFGQRTVLRPVVAPIATRPFLVPSPVVGAYYAPPVRYVAPAVTTYRLPVPAYVEVYGY